MAEFRIAPTTINEPMFDVSVQGLTLMVHPYETFFLCAGIKGEIQRTTQQTVANLRLTNFSLLDPNTKARYPKVG